LLCLAEGPATGAHVEPVGVDQAILSQRCGIEFCAGDGVDVKHIHRVNFLKRAALGLDHEEVDDEEKSEAAGTEHQTVEVVDVVCDHRREERDQEVEEPVGCGREGHADSAVTSRVELSDDSPDKGSPGGGESCNEQAGEDNHDVTGLRSALRERLVELVVADECVDEETGSHPSGTSHHGLATSDVLNDPQTEDGGGNVDGTEDDRSNVGVLETSGSENGSSVVELNNN
jgi:hypothetical protein